MHGRAGGIHRQLLSQVPRDLFFVGQEQFLEFAHVFEFQVAARKLPAGVNVRAQVERERLPVLAEADFLFAFAIGAVFFTPAAENVKILALRLRPVSPRT